MKRLTTTLALASLSFSTLTFSATDRAVQIIPANTLNAKQVAYQYWADYEAHTIVRAHLDGSNETVIADQLETPYGIAYLPIEEKLYWTSSEGEVIKRMSVNGGVPESIETEFEAPFVIEFDYNSSHVTFYIEDNVIRKNVVNLNNGIESDFPIYDGGTNKIHGLAVDLIQETLYWGDENGRITHRSKMDGTSLIELMY